MRDPEISRRELDAAELERRDAELREGRGLTLEEFERALRERLAARRQRRGNS